MMGIKLKSRNITKVVVDDPRLELAKEVRRFDGQIGKVASELLGGTWNFQMAGAVALEVYQRVEAADFGEVVELPFSYLQEQGVLIPITAMLTTSRGYECYQAYKRNQGRGDEMSFFLKKHPHYYSGVPQVEVWINDHWLCEWDQNELFDPDRNSACTVETALRFEPALPELIALRRDKFIIETKKKLGITD